LPRATVVLAARTRPTLHPSQRPRRQRASLTRKL